MPRGRHWQSGEDGESHLIDVTLRHPDGTPIVPQPFRPPNERAWKQEVNHAG